MKKILLLMILIIMASLCLKSQDVMNPQVIDTLRNCSFIDTTATNFLFGQNWSSPGPALDSALSINCYHSGIDSNSRDINDAVYKQPIKMIVVKGELMSARNYNCLFNAQAILLNPTIIVDSTWHFVPKAGDTIGSTFGFCNKKHGIITTDSGFYLNNTSLGSGITDTVLSNMWKGDCMSYMDYISICTTFKL